MYQENNGFLEEVFDMRKILKIIVAPFVLVLILAVAVISFLSCIAGACCGLACAVFVLLAICGFFSRMGTRCLPHVGAGVPRSPLWLSGLGGWLLDRLYGMKYALQDFMFS